MLCRSRDAYALRASAVAGAGKDWLEVEKIKRERQELHIDDKPVRPL